MSAAIIGVLVLVLLSSHRPRDDVDADSFARCKNTTARAVAAPYDLTGRCIVITGGDSGLGFAASTALAASNADVIICSHNPAKGLQQAARIRRETNRTVRVVGMDLKRLASVHSAALQIIEMCDGQLDVLLANAGISETNDNQPVTSDGFDDIYQVGALGHTLLVEMLLPSLRRARGRVVYTSGAAAFYVAPTICRGWTSKQRRGSHGVKRKRTRASPLRATRRPRPRAPRSASGAAAARTMATRRASD